MTEREQLEQAIAALEVQRAVLGDVVVDSSIAALREKLAALSPTPRTEQKRKQTTILFADVSGFTAMSESLDAEEVADIMNALWQRLDAAITDNGGIIDKHIGDAVMALWGADAAREDDPERAVRGALDMQAALAIFRDDHQVKLAMRIGINTGPVLLGEVGTTGEFTAMGDTVNTASRLEHAAPVGGILISHDTYQHVRGVFDIQPQDPLQVKGKVEPLQVYVVERARAQAFRMDRRGVEHIETRMIGREAEMKQLQDTLYTAIEDGERQMLTVVAEAGVGKSRLLYEYERWVNQQPENLTVFKGRANQEIQNLPHSLLRTLFAFRFQIKESDRAEVVREKLERGIAEQLGADDRGQMKAHFIGQSLGFDFSNSPHLQGVLEDTRQVHNRTLIYLTEFFAAAAGKNPVLIFWEDIHWADDSSLDVINHLALKSPHQRLQIVCLTRPSLFERRPHWGEGQGFHHRLDLRPLSKWDSRRLVAEILQKVEAVPAELRDEIVNRAEGNPFYVEELIKMLIEDGVIIAGDAQWRVEPDRLARMRVPPTLTGILQARLDSLPAVERTILQQASVIGRAFWDQAVARINQSAGDNIDDQQVIPTLSALREREMVFRRETSAFEGAQEHLFKHAVLRDVTYESVLMRARRVFHALAAEWLIEKSGDRISEHAGLIADHLELAGQTEQAVIYLRKAGEEAAKQYANREAIAYYSRALKLTPETNLMERYTLLLAREQIYYAQGVREAQSQDLTTLEALAEALDDGSQQATQRRAEIALRHAKYAIRISNYSAAIAAVQKAVGLAKNCQAVSIELDSYREWGWALWRQGDYQAAQAKFQQSLDLARIAQLRQFEAASLATLAASNMFFGTYVDTKTYCEQALTIYREIGDRPGEADALNKLGFSIVEQGEDNYTQARVCYERSLLINREIGDREEEGVSIRCLGILSDHLGDYTQARIYMEQAVVIFREIGHRSHESLALTILADTYAHQGDYATAKTNYREALRIIQEVGFRQQESSTLSKLGLLHHWLGENERALVYNQQALTIAQEIGVRRDQGYALTRVGHVLFSLGQLEEAAAAYHQALAIQHEMGQFNRAMEAQAGLARLSLTQQDPAQALIHVEEILKLVDNIPWCGLSEPMRVYLTCYRVLQANQDARARDILNIAYTLLQERAANIEDEQLQKEFLENVQANREIVAEWTKSFQA